MGLICPICFLDYTASEPHRITSLKCGHCFGHKCILTWVSLSKHANCPTCAAPARRAHLRPIFLPMMENSSNRILDEKLIGKYIEEKEQRQILETEIATLKTRIDMLQNANSVKKDESEIGVSGPLTRFIRMARTHFIPCDNVMAYDVMTDLALISCCSAMGNGFYQYSLVNQMANRFNKLGMKISGMKISPFNDGISLIAAGNSFSLFNLCNGKMLLEKEFDCAITAVSFDDSDRDKIYAADCRGKVYYYRISTGECVKSKILKHSVHSLCFAGTGLYAASVFEVFRISLEWNNIQNAAPVEVLSGNICTNLSSQNNVILGTFRSDTGDVSFLLSGKREILFFPGIRQKLRHSDQIHGRLVYAVDDYRNVVCAFDVDSLKCVHTYSFSDQIINLAVSNLSMVVLTRKGLYWYGSEPK